MYRRVWDILAFCATYDSAGFSVRAICCLHQHFIMKYLIYMRDSLPDNARIAFLPQGHAYYLYRKIRIHSLVLFSHR